MKVGRETQLLLGSLYTYFAYQEKRRRAVEQKRNFTSRPPLSQPRTEEIGLSQAGADLKPEIFVDYTFHHDPPTWTYHSSGTPVHYEFDLETAIRDVHRSFGRATRGLMWEESVNTFGQIGQTGRWTAKHIIVPGYVKTERVLKKKINRERKRLQKRLERAEQYLTEHRREALFLQSAVATDYQKQRAERLLKKLDKRAEAKVETDKSLDALLKAYDKKPQVSADSTPAESGVVPKPIPVAPMPVEIDPEAKAKRIRELEIEIKKIEHVRDLARHGYTQHWTPRECEEYHANERAIFAEYESLIPPKEEPVLTAEEAEQIRRQKMWEAAQEKLNEQIKAENMRAAGEWLTRADIKFRLNLTVDQPPSAPRMADGSLQLYGTEKVPKGWEDRY